MGESNVTRSFFECMDKQFRISKREALIKEVGAGLFHIVITCCWAPIIWVGTIVVTAKR